MDVERWRRDCLRANAMITDLQQAVVDAAQRHEATPYAVMMALASLLCGTLHSVAEQSNLDLEKVRSDFQTLIDERFVNAALQVPGSGVKH